jgi:hypothetical protein
MTKKQAPPSPRPLCDHVWFKAGEKLQCELCAVKAQFIDQCVVVVDNEPGEAEVSAQAPQ